MHYIDFDNKGNLHFIGIGGISMSGFAELLLQKGFRITGSDTHDSEITEHLEKLGINILYGQKASNIPEDTDLVIYTAAISDDNPELAEARRRGLPTMVRAEMIGRIMKNYSNAIAVSGTHGKTTVTSMLSHIYIADSLDPTVSVGAMLDIIGGNIRVGNSDNWIMEACEYTNSFLSFCPTTAVVLNIEEDHLDFFNDINDIRKSFRAFTDLLPDDGLLVINRDITKYTEICPDNGCRIVTYSTDDHEADYYADNITYDNYGCASYDLFAYGQKAERINLSVPGLHNISNSLAAIAVAYTQKLNHESVVSGLMEFHGADRRFQIKGEFAGITVIDDYAHHPSEIKATLTAAANYPHNNIWCVFQPHTYSRTKAFLKEFAEALTLADKIILTDIYAAREQDTGEVSSGDILIELKKLGKEAYHFSSFDDIENFILKNCVNGDMLITMGAGDVVSIGEELLNF